ncbi:MAG: Bax inhibitor-1/YccA family protein [Bacteroidia bacterium]|nr:Bax inhibitor-1/YccA family protein [Bacteroidia bacterium]
MIARTSNPAFSKKIFEKTYTDVTGDTVMTLKGTVNKSFLMLLLVILGASYTWRIFFQNPNPEAIPPALVTFMLAGGIGGFILSLAIMFRPVWSPWAAPVYAVLQGLFLGAVSSFFEFKMPGIVIQAASLTFLTLLAMLFLYRTGIIKVTEKFRMGVFAATGGIALMYFAGFILGLFGINFPLMHSGGTLGIIVGVVICGVAALNLVLDFDLIDKGSQSGLPKFMEWYSAFALMVTLVWLYLEILRLLSRINSRN